MNKPSQGDLIIKYLKKRVWIDPLTALSQCGTMNLSTRISDLKSDGYRFKDKWVNGTGMFGNPIRYKRYRLES